MVFSRIVRLCLPNFVSPTGLLPVTFMAIVIPDVFPAVIARYWHIHVARKDLALANRWSELLQATERPDEVRIRTVLSGVRRRDDI